MNNQERTKAILNYENYDRLPIVHFGFWPETLEKWSHEGHITFDPTKGCSDGSLIEKEIATKLGFDYNWFNVFPGLGFLDPPFEPTVLKQNPDGSKEFLNSEGVVVIQIDGAGSIPAEVGHTLKDEESWHEHYKPRLQFREDTILKMSVNTPAGRVGFNTGGLEFLKQAEREDPLGLMIGSLLGAIRDWFGVTGLSYITFDNEKLLDEIIQTVSDFCYFRTEYLLKTGAKFDFAHFWEDVCFKSGPLITPDFFYNKIGPHYKRMTELVKKYGINIVSVDCDGLIDSLIPTWLENGVNTMFPIEVGTWDASIKPWRKKYGKELRGVGGMNKNVFSRDYAAVDAEIERLKPLVELGGYIPCPDHRIAPDAKWENVQYYCEKMREIFS